MRLQLARELHDGILQVLTGASLQIAAAVRLGRRDPEAAFAMLSRIGTAISEEQRELRLYVDEMFGVDGDEYENFDARLETALARVQSVWDVEVVLDASPVEADQGFGRVVVRVIQEAVVNAARHGGASQVVVKLRQSRDGVTIAVSDNGDGFPFQGHYDNQALRNELLGPVSLKQRIDQFGGTLEIDSLPTGATLTIALPRKATSPW